MSSSYARRKPWIRAKLVYSFRRRRPRGASHHGGDGSAAVLLERASGFAARLAHSPRGTGVATSTGRAKAFDRIVAPPSAERIKALATLSHLFDRRGVGDRFGSEIAKIG